MTTIKVTFNLENERGQSVGLAMPLGVDEGDFREMAKLLERGLRATLKGGALMEKYGPQKDWATHQPLLDDAMAGDVVTRQDVAELYRLTSFT